MHNHMIRHKRCPSWSWRLLTDLACRARALFPFLVFEGCNFMQIFIGHCSDLEGRRESRFVYLYMYVLNRGEHLH